MVDAAFLAEYSSELRSLETSDKAQINLLTMLAEDNKLQAAALVDIIARHTVLCPPHQKVPALYLMDSIVKNVGEPYLSAFAERVPELYASSWGVLTADAARTALTKLFNTWKGLFGEGVLAAVLAAIHRGSNTPSPPPGAGTMPCTSNSNSNSSSSLSNGKLLPIYEGTRHHGGIGAINASRGAGASQGPARPALHGWTGGMPQQLFGTGFAAGYRGEMPPLGGGVGVWQAAPAPAPAPSFPQLPATPAAPSLPFGAPLRGHNLPAGGSSTTLSVPAQPVPAPHAVPHTLPVPMAERQAEASITRQLQARPPAAVSSEPPPTDVGTSMLSTLSNWLTPRSAPFPAAAAAVPPAQREPRSNQAPETFDPSYIRQFHPDVLDELEHMTAQLRPKHLDYHFLRRRREKSEGVRSRNWYVNSADWIAVTTYPAEGVPDFFEHKALAEAEAQDEAGAEALHSEPVDEAQPECAISGEPFERFWHEGDQQWHYRDAVRLHGAQAENYGVANGALVKFQCLGELEASPSLLLELNTDDHDGKHVANEIAATIDSLDDATNGPDNLQQSQLLEDPDSPQTSGNDLKRQNTSTSNSHQKKVRFADDLEHLAASDAPGGTINDEKTASSLDFNEEKVVHERQSCKRDSPTLDSGKNVPLKKSRIDDVQEAPSHNDVSDEKLLEEDENEIPEVNEETSKNLNSKQVATGELSNEESEESAVENTNELRHQHHEDTTAHPGPNDIT